jgi:HK97 gp10 family phage protein
MARTSVTGFQQIAINIRLLEKKLGRGAMRVALTKSARLVVADAKRRVPVRTGTLKKSLRAKVKTYVRRGTVMAIIGPSRSASAQADFGDGKGIQTLRPAKYSHLVEFGTATKGVRYNPGAVQEPGNPPKPFLRPALESTKDAARATFAAEIGPAIQQEAAKIRRASMRAASRNR